jgi:type I restriction enzyme M protein
MEYWAETMQDDVYAVCFDGYGVGRKIAYEYAVKKKKVNGTTVEEKTNKVKSYDGEIIPKSLLIEHFYPDELQALQKYQGELDSITAQVEALVEENNGEDGYFSFLVDMKDATIKAHIKAIKIDADSAAELEVLQEYLRLSGIESDAKKLIKESNAMLDMVARDQYEQLTDEEIKQLLVEKKWFRAIYNSIDAIHSAVSHRLSSRVSKLVERYEFTLPECEAEVAALECKVKSHLERMGFAW